MRDRKQYMRKYQTKWLHKRKKEWFDKNGPCKKCGSTEDLEVDHIYPKSKMYQPNQLWSRKQEVRDAELKKCQVLCYRCHRKKSAGEFKMRYTGVSNLKLRTISDETLIKVRLLVFAGMSERKACATMGVSRGTYSSHKIRGHRKEVFRDSVKGARHPVKMRSPGASPGLGAKL